MQNVAKDKRFEALTTSGLFVERFIALSFVSLFLCDAILKTFIINFILAISIVKFLFYKKFCRNMGKVLCVTKIRTSLTISL